MVIKGSTYVSTFIRLLNVIFLFVFFGLIFLLLYWYFTLNIQDTYIRNLVIIILVLYSIIIVAELIIIPIVIYLIYYDFSLSESIQSYSSLTTLYKANPVLVTLVGFSMIISFFSLLFVTILSNELKNYARENGYLQFYDNLNIISSLNKSLFIMIVFLWILYFIIKGAEYLIDVKSKQTDTKVKSSIENKG